MGEKLSSPILNLKQRAATETFSRESPLLLDPQKAKETLPFFIA
jgi:hypothetical protein